MSTAAYLVMANGQIFQGEFFGAEGNAIAEVVFTTSMAGYMETLTDPNYQGQIVAQTFPLIGNYGVIMDETISDRITPAAYIVQDWCQLPSNFRSEGELGTFLKEKGVIAVKGINTRVLTQLLREHGAMNGAVVTDPSEADFERIASCQTPNAVSLLSTQEVYRKGDDCADLHIAILDLGMKKTIADALLKRNVRLTVCPHDVSADMIKALGVDGIVFSNGPGDPTDLAEVEENIRKTLRFGIPVFGIGMGHLLLARANGFTTGKMHIGHRGSNHSVKDRKTGKIYITGQNHGYVVQSPGALSYAAQEFLYHVNDGTNEGLLYRDFPAISVQFTPGEGPQETEYLYDEFLQMVGRQKVS